MKRITIKDLAEMLKINPSTVSRALSNHPDISDAVKQRVRETAELFNYVPNDFAVNFRKKSSRVIGLIIPEMSMFFIPSIIKGVASQLTMEGYNFFLLSSEESYEKEKENLKTCANSRVDGVLISLTSETHNLEHLKSMNNLGIPLVIFDKTVQQNLYDQVIFDNEKYAKYCAEKLVETGCKKILAVFGSENLDMTISRQKAFLKVIEQHPEIRYKSIFCDSPEMVKEKLDIILEYETFDGYFAMSDEILAGLSTSLKANKIDENGCFVVAISEGLLPKFLNPNYMYETNDGNKMGLIATRLLLSRIREGSELKDAEPKVYYI